jgi:hypothetical protein
MRRLGDISGLPALAAPSDTMKAADLAKSDGGNCIV